MTIMVDHEIVTAIASGDLVIEPFDKTLLQPNSIDVRLADQFRSYTASDFHVLDPYDKDSLEWGLRSYERESIVIYPGEFLLGATVERFCLPDNIVGQLTGKSSLARIGIMVHVTAGYIDAGFSHPPATLTLEIVNMNSRPVRLHAEMPIAQMVFTRTEKCTVPYNLRRGAKYNGQQAAAPSLYHLNEPHKRNSPLGERGL